MEAQGGDPKVKSSDLKLGEYVLEEKADKELKKLGKDTDEGLKKIGKDIDKGVKKLVEETDKGIKKLHK